MHTISFEGVSKNFGTLKVLDRFSMHVASGEMKIILGGSGSGKSTILKMILGLVRPDEGSVSVGEHRVSELSEDALMPIRSTIGMVFQAGALFDSLTVGENVAYRLRERGELSESEMKDIVLEVLGFVGLASSVSKMPAELSGGMRRRVAIARALVGNPAIMLYDEPTAGLDPITSRTICELVIKLRDLEKVTSVFVTHDLSSAMTLAREVAVGGKGKGETAVERLAAGAPSNTRFLILEGGRTLLEGDESDLEETPDAYIREFLD